MAYGFLTVLAAGVGAFGLVKLLGNKADNAKPKAEPLPTRCKIPTNVAIFQANQAFLSQDIQFIQATMAIFDAYGCRAEAQAMRDYLAANGYNPDGPILPVAVPTANGQVLLQPGEVWRAAAILGGIGCAVGLGTIADKIKAKGFTNVNVYSKNPGWGGAWDANEGFLECTRYVQATVTGNARGESKPKQVYRLERVSTSS